MKIRYLGHSCFQLISKNSYTVLTDPYTGVGYELPQGLTADIVTVSHGHFDHNYLEGINNEYIAIKDSAKYENENVIITGIDCFHDNKRGQLRGKNVIFKILMDGLDICHFGDLGEPLSSELLQKIGAPDILLIPVGGTYTIDAKQAKEYAEKIPAKAVIPMHYRPQDGVLDITDGNSFLSLCKEEEVLYVPNGEYVFDIEKWQKNDKTVVFMERVKI